MIKYQLTVCFCPVDMDNTVNEHYNVFIEKRILKMFDNLIKMLNDEPRNRDNPIN